MTQKYLLVAYQMYTNSAASHKLLYESTGDRPDGFVTGMGLMLDEFERRLSAMQPGEHFDFTLRPQEAFGERDEQLVRALPRKAFEIRGKFDEENIYAGNEVEMMDPEGNIFRATIVRVTDTEVTVDLNNPLAGRALQFVGTLMENREATLDEIARTSQILAGECGCDGCGGGCGEGGCGGGCGNS